MKDRVLSICRIIRLRIQNMAAIGALSVLALVGVLAVMSAPGKAATVTTAPNTTRYTLVAGTSVPTDAPTASPTAATDPTATPTQQPSPTATPSWHEVASYSGTAMGPIGTLHDLNGPVRIDYTCQVTDSLPSWTVGFSMHVAGQPGLDAVGGGTACDASHTSGSINMGTPPAGLDWDLSEGTCTPAPSCAPSGAWTATVEEWQQ